MTIAHPAHPPTEEETPHGCYSGVVFVGHIGLEVHGRR
jgi:hypothetical protein